MVYYIKLILLLGLLIGCNSLEKGSGDSGFVKIFDGETLDGWEGDSTYWRVENGMIVGEVTPQNLLERNTFLIWREGEVQDFELKLEYRVSKDGNSGINYRSEEVNGDPDQYIGGVPYALRGYQADLDGQNHYTGMNYEERKRTTIARRGEKVILPAIQKQGEPLDDLIDANTWTAREVVGLPEDRDSLTTFINEGWNEYHIIAQGNHLQHYVNGVLMSEVIDEDVENRKMTGLLGVQVHVGPPMKIEYRNILLKELK